MGIAKKIIGATKHDVDLAKLELKSKKMELSEERRRLFQEGLQAKRELKESRIKDNKKKAELLMEEKMASVERLAVYTLTNIDAFKTRIDNTQNEYSSNKSALEPLEEAYTARHNRRGLVIDNQKADLEFYNARNKCWESLKYLYLTRDYFEFLSNYVCGITLTKTQAELIDTVSKYLINGSPILNYGFDEETPDDSLLGAFKEIKSETLGMIGIVKFSASSYVANSYGDKINAYVVPDVDASIEKYISSCESYLNENDSEESDTDGEIECPNCHKMLAPDSKFCSQCGTKIEIPKAFYCSQCGALAQPGSRFCSSCGNKF